MKNYILAILLGALSVTLPCMAKHSPDTSLQSALTHTNQAKQYLAQQDLARARSELKLAIRIDPTFAEAYRMLGHLDLHSGNIPGAISAFAQAVKLEPNSFSSHYGLAMAYLRDRNIKDGLQELKSAVSIHPHDVNANYNLGVLLLDQGHPTEAIVYLRQAQALGRERPDLAYNLIRAELAANKLAEAKEEGRRAARFLASDINWQAAVGQLFLESHQPHDAIPYLSRALTLEPESTEVRRHLAAAYLESNQPGQAFALIKDPQAAEDYYLLASAHYLLRQYELAARDARTAVRMDPRQPPYLLLGARIEQHLGQHDSALYLLENTIKLAPKWANPYYSASVSLYCEKRYTEAQKYLKESLALQPDSARALFLYAVSLVNQGKNQEGETCLRKAVILNPSNTHFRYYLGEILMRENRLSDAEEVYRQAIRIDPKYAPLHYQLGKLLLRLNHPYLAEQETEKAISYDPNLAEAYSQLIQVYNRLGEREKSARAAAIFARLKKRNVSDSEQFYEGVKKELDLP